MTCEISHLFCTEACYTILYIYYQAVSVHNIELYRYIIWAAVIQPLPPP